MEYLLPSSAKPYDHAYDSFPLWKIFWQFNTPTHWNKSPYLSWEFMITLFNLVVVQPHSYGSIQFFALWIKMPLLEYGKAWKHTIPKQKFYSTGQRNFHLRYNFELCIFSCKGIATIWRACMNRIAFCSSSWSFARWWRRLLQPIKKELSSRPERECATACPFCIQRQGFRPPLRLPCLKDRPANCRLRPILVSTIWRAFYVNQGQSFTMVTAPYSGIHLLYYSGPFFFSPHWQLRSSK